jgi:carbamoyltransferase
LGTPASTRRTILIGHANTWHDPAIALNEGDRFFAESVERHTQCKRALESTGLWYSWRSLRRFLASVGEFPLKDADVLALTSWSGQQPLALLEAPARNPVPALLAASVACEPLFLNELRWMLRGHSPRPFTPPEAGGPGVRPANGVAVSSRGVMHQLAHAANAVYTSPFEECAVMVIDGYGEGTAQSFFRFADNRFELLHSGRPQVSLGLLYAAVTQFCGFDPYEGEEWKVMGLGAFGRLRPELYRFFKDRLEVEGLDVRFRPASGAEYAFDTAAWRQLEDLAGGFRAPDDPDVLKAADLAHAFQRAFEELLVELAGNFADMGLSKNLAFGGGCALNSAANGRIVRETAFEALHVPSAPGDDGNALGAVLYEKHHDRAEPRPLETMSPYLGSTLDPREVRNALSLGGVSFHEAPDDAALCAEVAEMLAAGRIVAWVQGRAEFGPRALGNRSILADPRPADMKDRINSRVKFREFYRPLAPSILDEHGPEYFEGYQASPYMERTLPFRPEVRARVPAVVHEDGSGRLQSVRLEWNPLFHQLLTSFRERTGIPLVLNTSFNVMGKPIVHSVQDAVAVYFTSGLDALIIGRLIVCR